MFANAWLAISLNPQSLVFSKWSKSNHCINYSAWFEQNNNKHQHKHLALTSWFHQKPTMLFRVLLKNNLNLWCNQCEATKRFPESMTTRFGSVATIRHSRYTTQNGVANPCSLCSLVWTQIFFFPNHKRKASMERLVTNSQERNQHMVPRLTEYG